MRDARAAVRWLRDQSSTYRIDSTRIGAWGSSAGGMVVTAMVAHPEEEEVSSGDTSSAISAGVAVSAGILPAFRAHVTSASPPLLFLQGCDDTLVCTPLRVATRVPLQPPVSHWAHSR